jgi:catechol 2,3-dioxygenase-like lactoylglutathione lyase family enzyme
MAEAEERIQLRGDLEFGHAVPILRVSDFERSIQYYLDRLGFKEDWRFGRFGSVSRGNTSLMLSEGSQGCSSTWLWVGVGDADMLYQELLEREAHVRQPPTNYPWGSREVHVFDPDRHVLRFGSEAPEDAPLGPWLDEAGVLWMPEPDGSWERLEQGNDDQVI